MAQLWVISIIIGYIIVPIIDSRLWNGYVNFDIKNYFFILK